MFNMLMVSRFSLLWSFLSSIEPHNMTVPLMLTIGYPQNMSEVMNTGGNCAVGIFSCTTTAETDIYRTK